MTTERQQIDVAKVWRAIGYLEGLNWKKTERINHVDSRYDDLADDDIDRISETFDCINKKIDRLFYAVIGIGAATIASVWASNLFGS